MSLPPDLHLGFSFYNIIDAKERRAYIHPIPVGIVYRFADIHNQEMQLVNRERHGNPCVSQCKLKQIMANVLFLKISPFIKILAELFVRVVRAL